MVLPVQSAHRHLEVIDANPDLFEVEILTAQTNDKLLIEQALKYQPNAVVIGDEKKYEAVKSALGSKDIKVFAGSSALEEVADFDTYDMMLAGIVGFAGLTPTLKAVEKGKAIALANKETLGGCRRYCHAKSIGKKGADYSC